MKGIILSFSILFVFSMMSTSCKEDEQKSKTDLLTDKNWVISKAEAYHDGKTKDATTDFIESCERDDVKIFSKDGKYVDKVGTDICETNETDEIGTWAWRNGENILNITSSNYSSDLELVSISNSILKIAVNSINYDMDDDNIEESNVKMTITFIVK